MFLHGGDYCPEQWKDDMSLVSEDIKKLKAANINCVTIGMFSWNSIEPTDGIYNIQWFTDVTELLNKNNIQVILGTATASRPHWLAQKYPSTSRININGIRELSGRRHNHCMSDPIFREKAKAIIEKQLEAISGFGNIHSIHINNEVNGACYCDGCVSKFQMYLEDKYKTIEALNNSWWNEFWSHTYNDFKEILPPTAYGDTSNTSLLVVWDEFTTWNHKDYVSFEKEIIRNVSTLPVSTNFCGTPFTTRLDYYELAKALDYISYDVYPYWQRNNNYSTAIAVKKDMLSQRDLDGSKEFYIMESTPGGANWRPCTILKSGELHEASTFLQILCGAKSTLYFQLKQTAGSNEKFHGSVMDINSDTTGRVYNYVKEYGRKLGQLDKFFDAKTVDELGIYLSWDTFNALHHSSGPRNKGYKAEEFYDSIIEYFNNIGINCSFIYDSSNIDNYKYIIVPFGYAISDEVLESLKSIPAEKVIAFPMLGYANKDDLLHFGTIPHKVSDEFGIRFREFTALEDSEIIADDKYEYEVFAELIESIGADCLHTFKDDVLATSITKNIHNDTEYYYVAGIPTKDSMIKLFDYIFDTQYKAGNQVIRNKYVIDGSMYEYLINFGEEDVTVENIEWKSSEDNSNILRKYEFAIVKHETL